MQRGSTRTLGVLAAVFLLFLAGSGGCGHSSFDFLSDQADMNSGSGGGSPPPPPPGSGGWIAASSGGAPNFPASGGLSGGGEGGGPSCVGPGCGLQCCSQIDLTCRPFDTLCAYCSDPDQCPPGTHCDPFTNQCMAACDDDFDCPDAARLCDEARGVCVQCYENVHCRSRDMSCEWGFCFSCDDDC